MNPPLSNPTEYITDMPYVIKFSVITKISCYVRLRTYNSQDRVIKDVTSEVFKTSQVISANIPTKTKKISVDIGLAPGFEWMAPFKGEKGLEITDQGIVCHDALLGKQQIAIYL